jgi:hypothetical protein
MKSDEILIKTFDQVKNDNFDQVKFDQVIVCLHNYNIIFNKQQKLFLYFFFIQLIWTLNFVYENL